ncbi:hypothetical protein ES319_A01G095000v1 [Gossypium barbadense]|uniref:Uncharacterized protein n=1 Tax=Gossypium barbadense TaxID=3634 RepID=A0A5J5WVX3_GOSBA|nr:hypothetical protein ES319_A01G095000v1 [Gossypium barbadense]
MHLQLQALPFQTLQQLPCSFNFPPRQHKDVTIKGSHSRHPSVSVKSLPRRVFLQLMGFSPISLCIYPLFAAPMQDMNEPEVIRTLKLSSGVRIQEIIEGEGRQARDGDYVQVNYVCRRSNGYFVHSLTCLCSVGNLTALWINSVEKALLSPFLWMRTRL